MTERSINSHSSLAILELDRIGISMNFPSPSTSCLFQNASCIILCIILWLLHHLQNPNRYSTTESCPTQAHIWWLSDFFEILRGETIRLTYAFSPEEQAIRQFHGAARSIDVYKIRRDTQKWLRRTKTLQMLQMLCPTCGTCTGRFVSWGFARIGKQLHLLSHVSRQRERGPIPIYVEEIKRQPISSHLQLQEFPTFHPRWIHIYQYPIDTQVVDAGVTMFFFKNILGDSWSPSSASCCFQALAQQHPSLLLEHHQLCDFLEWAVWSLAEFGTVIRSSESMPKLQFNYQTPDLRACLQGSPAFTFSLTRHIIDPFDPVCVQTSDGTPRFFRKFSSAEFHLEFTFCGLFWEVSFAPCPAVRYT